MRWIRPRAPRLLMLCAEPARTAVSDVLVGGTPAAGDSWAHVVAEEAARQGKSAVVPQFLAAMNVRWKAGSYEFGPPVSKVDYAIDGWISIPFDEGLLNQSYLFGDFVSDLVLPCDCATRTNSGDAAEMARGTIASALATW